ncbi:MAG: hypothetical protein K6U74_15070 [Firmicutes bacterium]|nr:hypothetical protein [Bacillota bacterium]
MKHPEDLDWGPVTIEFFSEEENTAVHVFNCDLMSPDNVERCKKFVLGKLKWYKHHLPQGCKQAVIFDDRGQNINDNVRDTLKNILCALASEVSFVSEDK